MGAGYDVTALGLGMAVVAALLACRCAAQAQAPGPAQPPSSGGSGCMPELVSLSPCMGYVSGNTTAPGAPCCSAVSGVLGSSPRCLCMVLGGTAATLGVAVDGSRALQLPGACRVQTPPTSQCESLGIPVPSPANPTASSTPATPSDPSVTPAANAGSGSKATPTPVYSDGNVNNAGRIVAFIVVGAAITLIHVV